MDLADVRELGLDWFRELSVDAVRFGLVIQVESGHIVFSNPAANEMLGLHSDEMWGRTSVDPRWRAVTPDGDPLAGEHHPAMVAFRTGAAVHDFLMGARRPTGELRWFSIDAFPLHDSDGRLVAVASAFKDVTEREAVRRKFMRSQRRLELALRAGRVGLWEWHVPSGNAWHDTGFIEITGVDGGSTEDWLSSVHPEDRPWVLQNLEDTAAGAGRSDISYRFISADGTMRWLASHSDVIARDERGRPEMVAGSIVDVTSERDAGIQAGLLMDHMSDGYFVLGRDWKFTYLNRRAVSFLGRSCEELVGTDVWSQFPGAAEGFRAQYEQAMAGEPVEFQAYYDGLDAWFEVRAQPVPTGIAVLFRDVTQQRIETEERERLLQEAESNREHLAHAATHDPLTGLPNRVALTDWLGEHLPSGANTEVAVLFLDLDRFKLVNDSHGHSEGDALLIQAGQRLQALVGPQDLVARLGGDEFVMAVRDASEGAVANLVSRALGAFREPFEFNERRLVVTTSLGIAYATSGATAETVIRDADAALYQAKDSGRDQAAFFDADVRARVCSRLALEQDLRAALQAGEITAHFQPIFDVRTGAAVAAEALARWPHPERGFIPPAEFVQVAEETGLIQTLGQVMFENAAGALPALDDAARHPGVVVWVNVSARQLENPSFADDLIDWVDRRGLRGRFGVEVTETALAANSASAASNLRKLTAADFLIAIDDFGTGYSSMSRLADFPVNMLKIDQSFVLGLDTPTGTGIVSAIIALAHAIGAEACAEGVETKQQLDALLALEVDKVSGYYLCRPAPAHELRDATSAGVQLCLGTRQHP